MVVSFQENELLTLSGRKYAIHILVLTLIGSILFYIFGPELPWKINLKGIIYALLFLFLYTITTRIIVPKQFAKAALYVEICVSIAVITAVVYFSGGILSPLNLMFIVPVIFAIFLIGANFGWIVWGISFFIVASFILLPAGLPLTRLEAVAVFLIYATILFYLTFIFLILRESLIRLEAARKAAQERVTILENLTTRLKTLDRLKTEFVTRTSHQLRTPLSELKWGFDSLLAEEKGAVLEEQKIFLQQMSKSVENLVALVSQLLDISHIESEEKPYVFEKVDMVPILKSILDQSAAEIENKQLKVFLEADHAVYVKGESKSLEIVFYNIIENAIHYTPPKGSVRIFFSTENSFGVIHIRDTGIGISKEEQKMLFTRFYRGPRAARMVANGAGIGLSLAKEIVEKHGGTIIIESEEDKGTEVKISLRRYENA